MPDIIRLAPGRLDPLGGVADNFGSLVLEMAIDYLTRVLIKSNDTGRLIIRTETKGISETQTADFSIEELLVPNEEAKAKVSPQKIHWAAYALGCIPILNNHERLELTKGADITISSDIPPSSSVSSSAALEVASMLAVLDLIGTSNPKVQTLYQNPLRIAELCQMVENLIAGAPCGRMDQIASLLGQKGKLVPILCRGNHPTLEPASLPKGYTISGIYSAVAHSVSGSPYADMRIGARMAQRMLERMGVINHGGYLCDSSVDKYNAANIPRELKGNAFLQDGYTLDDSVVEGKFDPDKTYHPYATGYLAVSENERVKLFIELLKAVQAAGTGIGAEIKRAGELMYARHQCYTDAGLGHTEVDALANKLREFGPAQGIYGATITGGGSGGTVAVLHKDDEPTRQVIKSAMHVYGAETGNRPILFDRGSSDGALKLREAQLRLE